MTLKDLKSKPRLALLGASGLVAAGVFAGTTVMSQAAAPTAAAAPAQTVPAPAETADAPGTKAATATEKPEANEPALPGGGNSDTGSNVDHQFDGVE